jgi:hypothetical protein
MQIKKNTKKLLAYASLFGFLTLGQGCATHNIPKDKKIIHDSLIEEAVKNHDKIFRIPQKDDFSRENRNKYTLILNTRNSISLHLLNSVVKGLKGKITPNDELAIIIFNNTDGDERKARKGRRNNKKIAKHVEQYLRKFNPQFDWRIDMKLINYNKIPHPNSKEKNGFFSKLARKNYRTGSHILHYLLGDDIDSKIIYTGGHGVTRDDKFLIFSGSYNPRKPRAEKNMWTIPFKEYFGWENDPKKPKWLDLTCGSTCSGDKYSIEIEDVIQAYLSTRRCDLNVLNSLKASEKIDTDKLVRFVNNPEYIRNGLEQKLELKKRFFDKQ